jgi:hypothetical protein
MEPCSLAGLGSWEGGVVSKRPNSYPQTLRHGHRGRGSKPATLSRLASIDGLAKKPINKGFFESRHSASPVVHFATRVCKKPHTSKTLYGIPLFHAVPTCMLHARCIQLIKRVFKIGHDRRAT